MPHKNPTDLLHSASSIPHSAAPYTALAAGYDAVMAHVDYDGWVRYVHGLLQRHHPEAHALLELGCGTGSLAVRLQPLGAYDYLATDRSAAMLDVARRKAARAGVPLRFGELDFTDFAVEEPVDVVLLLYDGLNYLLEPEPIRALLRCAYAALRPGGIFLFDQSTPSNSLNNTPYFQDEGGDRRFRYVRRSAYDAVTGLHTTTLDVTTKGRTYHERHLQRAYTLDALRALIAETDFAEIAAYDDFADAPADDATERIHWVVRR